MITKCPKCGFSQPKDKFCANCGVDIELFEPQKSPLHKQIFKNTTVQIITLMVLIATAMSIIYARHSPNAKTPQGPIAETSSETPTFNQEEAQSSRRNQAQTPQTLQTNKIERPSPSEVSIANPFPKENVSLSNKRMQRGSPKTTDRANLNQKPLATATSPAELNQEAPPPSNKRRTFHVRFAEIPQMVLNDTIFKNSLLEDGGSSMRAGVYPLETRLSTITKKITGLSFLPGTRSRNLPIPFDDPISFQFTHSSEGEEYGLLLRFYPQINNNDVNLELEGHLHLRSPSNEPIINSALQGVFAIPKNHILVIELILPPTPINEIDMNALSSSPLSIMNRTDFLDDQTSLVILVQIR